MRKDFITVTPDNGKGNEEVSISSQPNIGFEGVKKETLTIGASGISREITVTMFGSFIPVMVMYSNIKKPYFQSFDSSRVRIEDYGQGNTFVASFLRQPLQGLRYMNFGFLAPIGTLQALNSSDTILTVRMLDDTTPMIESALLSANTDYVPGAEFLCTIKDATQAAIRCNIVEFTAKAPYLSSPALLYRFGINQSI